MTASRGVPGSRRSTWLAAALAVLALAIGSFTAPAASAHANLVRAVPAPGQSVAEPPAVVFAEFSEAIDPAYSRIEVLDRTGAVVSLGESEPDPTGNTGLLVRVGELPDGTYVVPWRTLSQVDGHIIRGSFVFAIGEPVARAVGGDLASPLFNSNAEPAFRWALFAGLIVLAAAPLHVFAVHRPGLRAAGVAAATARSVTGAWLPRLLAAAAAAALVGQLGQLVVQALSLSGDDGLSGLGPAIGDALGLGQWGPLWIARAVLVALAVAAVAWLVGFPRRSRAPGRGARDVPALGLLLASASAALVTVSLGSHAAALQDIALQTVVADVVHLLAAASWAGGLAVLAAALVTLRRRLDPGQRGAAYAAVAARFSSLAILAVGALVATGAFSAWTQIIELPRLWATPYGLTLIAKLALVLPLVGLGAVNLLWTQPRLAAALGDPRATTLLRRLVVAEVTIAALIVLATGFLTSLEPARQAAARDAGSIRAEAAIRDLQLALAVEPGLPGPNTVTLTATDDRGPVDPAAAIELQAKFLGADIGTSVLRPRAAEPGRFVVEADDLSLAGEWQVVAVVRRPGQLDARAPFRFQLGGGASDPLLLPHELDARRLWSILIAGLGLLFALGTLPATTWRASLRRAATGAGFGLMAVGMVVLVSTPDTATGRLAGVNPVVPDEASIAAGRSLFQANCTQCHGDGGQGDGPLAPDLDPPPLDLSIHVPLHPDGELFGFIRNGIPETAMPAFIDRFSELQIWNLINFLQTLPPASPSSV